MITDLDLLEASAAAYSAEATIVVAGDVPCHVMMLGDDQVIAFRGTVPTDIGDWLRDFDVLRLHLLHNEFGLVHAGVMAGAQAALRPLLPLLRRPYHLTGHSLGGALAIATAALLGQLQLAPVTLTTFGAPCVGSTTFADAVADVPGLRYRHGADPVPLVPVWPYRQDRPVTQIGVADDLNPVADHGIDRYRVALGAKGLVVAPQSVV